MDTFPGCRDRRLDGDRFFLYRVHELYPARMEAYSSVRIAARSTVLEVALDDHSCARELAAYLVVTAGEELDLEEEIAVGLAY